MPSASVRISGSNGSVWDTQVVAHDIGPSGDADIIIAYDADSNYRLRFTGSARLLK